MNLRAHRRALLVRFLAQPGPGERRPCMGCRVPCRCDNASPTCPCGCTPACALLPAALREGPFQEPVHPVYVPLLFELKALRVFSPYWPVCDHYGRLPSVEGVRVEVRSTCLEYVDLLVQHVAYLLAVGALSKPWHVTWVPHLSGSEHVTFALEPAAREGDAHRIAADLLRLARDLGAYLRRIARVRLFLLREPEGETASESLSPREMEVLELFLSGLSAESLARRLHISRHTARNHLKHVCSKLGVGSQRALRELFALPIE